MGISGDSSPVVPHMPSSAAFDLPPPFARAHIANRIGVVMGTPEGHLEAADASHTIARSESVDSLSAMEAGHNIDDSQPDARAGADQVAWPAHIFSAALGMHALAHARKASAGAATLSRIQVNHTQQGNNSSAVPRSVANVNGLEACGVELPADMSTDVDLQWSADSSPIASPKFGQLVNGRWVGGSPNPTEIGSAAPLSLPAPLPAPVGRSRGVPIVLMGPSIGAHRTVITEDYDMGTTIGDGGYACVQLARPKRQITIPLPSATAPTTLLKPTSDVVVKVCRKRFLVSDEERKSLVREVDIHRSLSFPAPNPRIVTLYDVYEPTGSDNVYLVLERVRGGDLQTYMRSKSVRSFSETQARVIIDQLLEALEHLHGRGILHADIKPSNILADISPLLPLGAGTTSSGSSGDLSAGASSASASVAADNDWQALGPASGTVTLRGNAGGMGFTGAGISVTGAALTSFITSIKLCDFGAARRARDPRYYKLTGDVGLAPWSGIRGSMGYIAPEILSQQNYTSAVDIWSCGIILFELLGGYAPFYPPSQCLTETVDVSGSAWDTVSDEAKQLVRALLQTDSSKRPSAAKARSFPWFSMKL
jgi:serine/threonine protein kinase